MQHQVIQLTIGILAVTLLSFAGTDIAHASGKLKIGTEAPDFTLPDMKGKDVTLSEMLENGPVLLDFWALWCKPCLKALPSTNALVEEFGDQGLTVLTINTDSPKSASKVRPYVKSKKYDFEVLMDPNRSLQRIFRFNQIPQVYLIDSDGSIAYSQLGYSHALEKRLHSEVARLFDDGDETAATESIE